MVSFTSNNRMHGIKILISLYTHLEALISLKFFFSYFTYIMGIFEKLSVSYNIIIYKLLFQVNQGYKL